MKIFLLYFLIPYMNKHKHRINSKIYFEIGTNYDDKMSKNNSTFSKFNKQVKRLNQDCALLPKGSAPRHKPIFDIPDI